MLKKIAHTIAVVARLANAKVVDLKRDKPAGNRRAIRKKCSVIAVALRPDTQRKC
jgi:hypothetical protein